MKNKLLVIGAGGHCKSCIDVIEQEGKYEISGVVAKEKSNAGLFGYPILGNDNDISELRSIYDYAFIAVGQIKSPAIRIRLYDFLTSLGFALPTVISPRAYVSSYAKIGEGTIIMHDALVNAGAEVGRNCIINTKALVEHDAVVGDYCHISTGSLVNGGAIVKQNSFVGSNAVLMGNVTTNENDFIKAGSLFNGHRKS